ncbi:MAG: glycosyltransferase [Pseudomonadota bacterium]
MRTIVHVTADYPDPSVPNKTQAIKNLISASHGYRHVVYSLNRVSNALGISAIRFDNEATSLLYPAPPKGLMLKYCMDQVAEWIAHDLLVRKIEPDLFHAHKLTIEGLAARKLAETFSRPFAVCIQGDTDLKVTKYKPGLRRVYCDIWNNAAYVFPFSIWAEKHFTSLFGFRKKPTRVLPCITPQDTLLVSDPTPSKRIISVFHLDSWKRKNARRLIEAVQQASKENPGIALDIYGSGSVAARRGLLNCIKRINAEGIVRLKGSVAHDKVQETINTYSMFALPSLRESFGMAAAEALMSGVPVLISKNWGIDGFFSEDEIGGICDPYSTRDMTEKIRSILASESRLKSRIADNQRSGKLDVFRTGSIVETYLAALGEIKSQAVFRNEAIEPTNSVLQV